MTKSAKIVTFGSLAAFGILLASLALRPDALGVNSGIGYFSNGPTIVLYALMYITLAATYWFAAGKGWLRGMLRTIAILLIAMLITPASDTGAAHMAVASALVSFQMVLSLWFVIKSLTWIDGLLITLQFIAGISILFSLGGSASYLLHAQVAFQGCFTGLLARALNAPTDKNILSI
jgi:hypothetical protein